MNIRFQILTLSLLGLLWGSGCGGQKLPDGLPKLYPCKITIMDKDGNPMQDVIVSVNPEDSGNRWGASGQTDAQGVATIKTAGQYPGLSSGKYNVTLMKFESVNTGKRDEEGNEIMDSKSLLPEKYTNFAQPQFRFEMGTAEFTETFQLE